MLSDKQVGEIGRDIVKVKSRLKDAKKTDVSVTKTLNGILKMLEYNRIEIPE